MVEQALGAKMGCGDDSGGVVTVGNVPVRSYRKILIWPLRWKSQVADGADGAHAAAITCQAPLPGLEAADGPWREIADPLKHLEVSGSHEGGYNRDEYAEFVYFHPFIQRFLYPSLQNIDRAETGDMAAGTAPVRPGKSARSMRIYRRDDVNLLKLRFGEGEGAFRRELAVERLRFYTFSDDVGLFVMELADKPRRFDGSKKPVMDYNDMLRINAAIRHCYAPFYTVRGQTMGLADSMVFAAGKRLVSCGMTSSFSALNSLKKSRARQPEILPCLKELLPALHDDFDWHHIVDDRMPSMTMVTVDDPARISEGDFQRLALHETGTGDPRPPYGPHTTAQLMENGELDLHWVPESGRKTRYAFLPTGMAMLTAHDFFGTVILPVHFRRHYFQMGLIAHMQHATLLSLSDELTAVLADVTGREREARNQAHDLLNRVLRFTHLYWFPEISNQLQPRLMFDRWQKSLGVQRLYETVMREAKEASDFLSRIEERQIAENSERLNKVAGIGVAVGVATGILGTNVFRSADDLGNLESWKLLSWFIGGVALIVWLLICIDRKGSGKLKPPVYILLLAGFCALMALVGDDLLWKLAKSLGWLR